MKILKLFIKQSKNPFYAIQGGLLTGASILLHFDGIGFAVYLIPILFIYTFSLTLAGLFTIKV